MMSKGLPFHHAAAGLTPWRLPAVQALSFVSGCMTVRRQRRPTVPRLQCHPFVATPVPACASALAAAPAVTPGWAPISFQVRARCTSL